MKLLNGYILVRVDEETTKTASGLLLQSDAVKLPASGTIEALADGFDDLHVGDHVQFLRYASLEGIEDGTRICTKDMILAVLNG